MRAGQQAAKYTRAIQCMVETKNRVEAIGHTVGPYNLQPGLLFFYFAFGTGSTRSAGFFCDLSLIVFSVCRRFDFCALPPVPFRPLSGNTLKIFDVHNLIVFMVAEKTTFYITADSSSFPSRNERLSFKLENIFFNGVIKII